MRIAIVNDTLMVTEALRRILKTIPGYEIVWIAGDGAQAVAKCARDQPDLILMDLYMPVMDGVEATRRIMADSPCAILIVTATVGGHAPKVFAAMGYGALDVVSVPIFGFDEHTKAGQSLLAKIATIGKLIGKPKVSVPSIAPRKQRIVTPKRQSLVVIGASTGGPQALATLLSELDPNFTAAIVIVQHVDVQFAPGLVEWLRTKTRLPVELAIAGCQPEMGQVLVAASNDHLVLQSDQTLAYTRHPREYAYRPSVDVFFKSVAQNWRGKGVGVLLTGMGRDGAEGMRKLRSAGWHTIAQEQASCVVYGMPKAAVELGAAIEVLPIDAIAPSLIRLLQCKAIS